MFRGELLEYNYPGSWAQTNPLQHKCMADSLLVIRDIALPELL
jgi:hypothetical protein